MIVYVAARDYAYDGSYEILGAALTPEGARIVAEGHLTRREAASVFAWEVYDDGLSYVTTGGSASFGVEAVEVCL